MAFFLFFIIRELDLQINLVLPFDFLLFVAVLLLFLRSRLFSTFQSFLLQSWLSSRQAHAQFFLFITNGGCKIVLPLQQSTIKSTTLMAHILFIEALPRQNIPRPFPYLKLAFLHSPLRILGGQNDFVHSPQLLLHLSLFSFQIL